MTNQAIVYGLVAMSVLSTSVLAMVAAPRGFEIKSVPYCYFYRYKQGFTVHVRPWRFAVYWGDGHLTFDARWQGFSEPY